MLSRDNYAIVQMVSMSNSTERKYMGDPIPRFEKVSVSLIRQNPASIFFHREKRITHSSPNAQLDPALSLEAGLLAAGRTAIEVLSPVEDVLEGIIGLATAGRGEITAVARSATHGAHRMLSGLDSQTLDTAHVLHDARADSRRLRQAPTELGEVVESIDQSLAIDALKSTTEVGRVAVPEEILRESGCRIKDVLEVGGLVSTGISGVDGSALELVVTLDGETGKSASCHVELDVGNDKPALARLVGSAGTSETVNVLLPVGGRVGLDDVGNVGEIHASGGNVGGEEDTGTSVLELLGGTSSGALGELGVNVPSLGNVPELPLKTLEDRIGHDNLSGSRQEDDGLERKSLGVSLGLVDGLLHELQHGRVDVLETLAGNDVLRDTVVGQDLIGLDGLHELEVVLVDVASGETNNILGNGGRVKQSLAGKNLAIGKVVDDLAKLLVETNFEHSIGLVENKGRESGGVDAAVAVGKQIVQATGGANKDMAALLAGLVQHSVLLGTTNGSLDDNTGSLDQLTGLLSDLLRKLAGWRDDDGANVIRTSSLATKPVGEIGILGDDLLDHRDEETKRLASSGLGLSNTESFTLATVGSAEMEVKDLGVHVLALESGADGHRLDFGHVLVTHAMSDGADDVLMNTQGGEVGEAGNEAIGGSSVALDSGLGRVEAGKGGRGKGLNSGGAGDLAQEGGRGLGGDLEMAGSEGGTAEAGLAQYAGPHVGDGYSDATGLIRWRHTLGSVNDLV